MEEEILQKYIAGEATEEEKQRVTLWIEADKEHLKEFLALRKLYTITIWQDEEQFSLQKQAGTQRKALLHWGGKIAQIAAIFIIAFLLSYLFLKQDETEEPVMQTIYVPAGQRAEITLSDQTKVWLNAQTTLTFPNRFNKKDRTVQLDGEGYFQVSPDKEKPFTVQTEHYHINVLGTEFNVRAYRGKGQFETSLLTGSLRVESVAHHEKILLKPKEMVYRKNGKLHKSPISQYNYFLWKEGLICFDDNTIEELFSKLQLYFDVNIIVKNKRILNQRYSGKFRTNDGIEHILKTLQLRTKFEYEKRDDATNSIIIK